jgi:hypothetical protein
MSIAAILFVLLFFRWVWVMHLSWVHMEKVYKSVSKYIDDAFDGLDVDPLSASRSCDEYMDKMYPSFSAWYTTKKALFYWHQWTYDQVFGEKWEETK